MSESARERLLHEIAGELDRPSVYMGGPSHRSKRRAGAVMQMVEPVIQRASHRMLEFTRRDVEALLAMGNITYCGVEIRIVDDASVQEGRS
jgi:hypothetical protein